MDMVNTINGTGILAFDKTSIQKIGIFRALQLGDMLCVIPAIRALRECYPQASITLIGLPWQVHFVRRFQHYIDDFMEFPGWPGLPERTYAMPAVIKFLTEINTRHFDLVLQMQGNGNIVNPMCMLFGARYVAGFRRKDDDGVNHALFPILNEGEHEITRFLKLVRVVGADSNDISLEFPINAEEAREAVVLKERMALNRAAYVCIHPGARDVRRRWRVDQFAYIADRLRECGLTVLLTGSIEEKTLLQEVAGSMKHSCVNLVAQCGHVGIGALAALIKDSAGLVSNDTGVSHIAAALQVRSVVLFSPFSDPVRWSPLNTALHVCIKTSDVQHASDVFQVVLRHLKIPLPISVPE